MLQFQVLQLLVQRLVLANFARVVLLLENAHAAGDAWGVVRGALLTSDVELVDQVGALRTVVLLLRLGIMRRLSREQVNREQLIGLPLLLRDRVKPLELIQSLAALLVAPIEVGSNRHKTVDIFRLQLLFILDQSHCCLHGAIVVFLIELPLTKQVKVDGLSALPRIRQCLVG